MRPHLDHTGKVTQVEQVVRLCWCGKEIRHGILVHGQGGGHDLQSNTLDVSVEPLREVPVHDPAEDQLHGGIVKLVDGDGVEVAEEARGDGVTPTSWGTHGCYQQNVHQVDLLEGISINMYCQDTI